MARGWAIVCVLAACGGGEEAGEAPDAAPGPKEWRSLIDLTYTLAAGEEKNICATLTLTEDVYVSGYRPLEEPLVHHSTLSFDDPDEPDEPVYDCHGNDDRFWAFATGAGTDAIAFPEGVGMRLGAGQQLRLTTHLLNTGDETVEAHAGIEGFAVGADDIVDEAEVYNAGPVGFVDAPATLTSDCVLDRDQTLVSLLPHMHQRGRHFRSELVQGDRVITLHDGDFVWEHQVLVPLNQPAHAGDIIRTTCTWDGDGGPLTFGPKTEDEMCYSMLTRYPTAGSTEHFCGQ